MRIHGRVTVRRISSASFCATRPSRYSSRYFIDLLGRHFGKLVHLLEVLVSAGGLLLVDLADGEAHVHQDVVADLRVGNVFEAGLAGDAPEIDARHTHAAIVMEFDDLARYGEAHAHP